MPSPDPDPDADPLDPFAAPPEPAPRDPDWEDRCRAAFAAQGLMATFAAAMVAARPGRVVLRAPITPAVGQQHGYAHAALAFALGDSAAGFAAMSLTPPGQGVLTVEMKIALLAPAEGDALIATGRVLRPGRRLTAVEARVEAEADGVRRPVATLLGTMSTVAALTT